MTAAVETLPYHWVCPNGVEVYSCKPDVPDEPLLRFLYWSYKAWGKKIIWTQINRVRYHLTGYEVPIKHKHVGS